jgi:Uncharacterized protein conserved in bacteria
MPEVQIEIGGRSFDVACQDGEEQYLRMAARMLDTEAQVLVGQIGRIPEARMLLMAGLMLADKTAGFEDRLKEMEATLSEKDARIASLTAQIETLERRPPPEPQRIEVPVVPEGLGDTLAELAARAESLADQAEEKAGTGTAD